jgi:hypothetical protein
MKAKFRIISVIVISMLMSSAFAQQVQEEEKKIHKSPEEIAKAKIEWMKTDLKLDEATQRSAYDVLLKYARQSVEEKQKLSAAGDKEAVKAKLTEITAERDKELKVVLGDSNFEIFKNKEGEKAQAMTEKKVK